MKRDQETQINESKDADLKYFAANELYQIAKGRDKWLIGKSERFIEQENLITHAFVDTEDKIKDLEPSSYVEETSRKYVAQWKLAILHKNETWVLVKRPKGMRTIECKWVYRKKEGIPEVEDSRFKVRSVTKGFI